MEHGSINGTSTEAGNGDISGIMQGPVEKDTDYVSGGKKLDANDQKKMDKLHGARDAREQWTYDIGGDPVAEFRRKTEAEGGRKTGSPSKGNNKVVGRGTGENKRSPRNKRGNEGRGKQPKRVAGAGGEIRITGPGATARTALKDEAGAARGRQHMGDNAETVQRAQNEIRR